MSPFRESFQKELGRGTAYFLVATGVWIVCRIAGLLPGDKRPALTLLLFLGAGFLVWLFVILFLKIVSYKRTDKRVAELESQLADTQAEKDTIAEFLQDAGVFDNPKALKRVIDKEASDYADEHQDDGRYDSR